MAKIGEVSMSPIELQDVKNYWDVAGGGSCLGASDEGGRDVPQAGGIGAELRDELLNRRLLNTRPEGITALNR
jgi:hypothetical protein